MKMEIDNARGVFIHSSQENEYISFALFSVM